MTSKVLYKPIEAAIRWSGLQRYESQILATVGEKQIPDPGDFPRWPTLRLNCERIYDAILNGELRYALHGHAVAKRTGITEAQLPYVAVRHVDLKVWMTAFYPECKPVFLFSKSEREFHPAIEVRLQIEPRDQALPAALALPPDIKEHRTGPSALRTLSRDELGPRSEATYLHIVGGLLGVLLGRSASGKPNSNFRSQEAIINAMLAEHGDRLGISERTLEAKFAAAKRALLRE